MANLDIESDELDKFFSNCSSGWAIVSSKLTSNKRLMVMYNNIICLKRNKYRKKSSLSETKRNLLDIRSLDLIVYQ